MIVDFFCLILMLGIVGDILLGVWSRYVMGATFQWYDEVARLCFIWIIFLGAAAGIRRGSHFRLMLFLDRMSAGYRHGIEIIVGLCTLAFSLVLVAGGLQLLPIAKLQVTDSLQISMLWFYAAIPVGGALMAIYSVPRLWTLRRSPLASERRVSPGPRPE